MFSQQIVDGKVVSDPESTVNTLNQYFVNVPQQVNKDIPRTRKFHLDYLNNLIEDSLILRPTDSREIIVIILPFCNSSIKPTGHFSIPIRLLKTSARGTSKSYLL